MNRGKELIVRDVTASVGKLKEHGAEARKLAAKAKYHDLAAAVQSMLTIAQDI